MNERIKQNDSQDAQRTHKVVDGESLWSIAKHDLLHEAAHVTNMDVALQVSKIEKANHLRNPDLIHANDNLLLPPLQLVTGSPEVAPLPIQSSSFHLSLNAVQQPDIHPTTQSAGSLTSGTAGPEIARYKTASHETTPRKTSPSESTPPETTAPASSTPASTTLESAGLTRPAQSENASMKIFVPPSDVPAPAAGATNASSDQTSTPGSESKSVAQKDLDDEPKSSSGMDLLASLIAGQAGRQFALKIASVAAQRNPIAEAVVLGLGTIAGTAIFREGMDEASHFLLHTKRLTPAELATQSLAGAGGALLYNELPKAFGTGEGKVIERTVTNGLTLGTLDAGVVNPFVNDTRTGKRFTVAQSAESIGTMAASGAAFSLITRYPAKWARFAWKHGADEVELAINSLKSRL